jgi:predicted metal-binding membrane protein
VAGRLRAHALAAGSFVPTPAAAQGLSGRDRAIIAGCLIAIVALAWGYLFILDRHYAAAANDSAMMAEMIRAMSRPWSATDLAFTFAMWLVMMIGMMTPSAAPMLLLFAASQAQRDEPRRRANVLSFALGYFAVWIGFSAVATLAQWALQRAALLSVEMATTSARLSGVILLAAGIYQLTPLKRACLTQCRSPLGFFMTHWRAGPGGALRMGVDHGVFCLGCCWALMSVLFVVGVMNLAWVAALTLLVLLEKVGPAGDWIAKVSGAALIAGGALFLAGVL